MILIIIETNSGQDAANKKEEMNYNLSLNTLKFKKILKGGFDSKI